MENNIDPRKTAYIDLEGVLVSRLLAPEQSATMPGTVKFRYALSNGEVQERKVIANPNAKLLLKPLADRVRVAVVTEVGVELADAALTAVGLRPFIGEIYSVDGEAEQQIAVTPYWCLLNDMPEPVPGAFTEMALEERHFMFSVHPGMQNKMQALGIRRAGYSDALIKHVIGCSVFDARFPESEDISKYAQFVLQNLEAQFAAASHA
jgi:hypothetical protein